MVRNALAALALATSAGAAGAVDARMARALMKIDPDIRLEQICDIEAMHRIGHDRRYRPDRAKSDVSTPPVHAGDRLAANGAAFRSRGQWYAFSFECVATPDHLRVLSLSLRIGEAIPRTRWAGLGLWQ